MSLVELYKSHLERLLNFYKNYLTTNNLAEAWVHFGDYERFFNTDQESNFRANPFALHLVNEPSAVGSYIRITKDGELTLFNYQDLGYWNVPISTDLSLFEQSGLVKVVTFEDYEVVFAELKKNTAEAVIIGPNTDRYLTLNFASDKINPQDLLWELESLRLVKTEYEYEMMCQAQFLAIKAHRALHSAVMATNLSENQLLGTYLQAAELPYNQQGYDSILAFNRNAAILHYNQLDFNPPAERLSFLVDAGAVYKGYQADISRTYCLDGNDLFQDLILGVSNIKDEIIGKMRPGVTTLELQELMLRKTAELLIDAEIFKNVTPETAVESKMAFAFIPHGFGHSLGIGVHDVMGKPKPRPEGSNVRSNHTLEVGNVWTVEPGIYFIDQLLAGLENNPDTANLVNWDLVAELHPYGGIRVEDNVMLQETQLVNFTGDLASVFMK